jgi:hypothetical protein
LEKLISSVIEALGVTELLDYGTGGWFRNLKVNHSLKLQAGKDGIPMQMVTCLDPKDLDLDELKRLTQAVGIFCMTECIESWMPKLIELFDIQTVQRTQDGYYVIVYSKPEAQIELQ